MALVLDELIVVVAVVRAGNAVLVDVPPSFPVGVSDERAASEPEAEGDHGDREGVGLQVHSLLHLNLSTLSVRSDRRV